MKNGEVQTVRNDATPDNFAQNWDGRLKQFLIWNISEKPMSANLFNGLGKEVPTKRREEFPFYNTKPWKKSGEIFIWKRGLTEEEKEKLREWMGEKKPAILLVGKIVIPVEASVRSENNRYGFRIGIPASTSRMILAGKHYVRVRIFEHGLIIILPKDALNPEFFGFKTGLELSKGGSAYE